MVPTQVRSTSKQFQPARKIEHIVEDLLSGVDWEYNAQLLFKRYFRLVQRYFHRHGCSPGEVEDFSQETFMRVYQSLPAFRGESRFDTWLLRIAENVYRRSFVKSTAAKRSAIVVSLEEIRQRAEEVAEVGSSGSIPLEDLLHQERIAQLNRVVSDLPAQMRRCVLLRGAQQLQYREIAEVLGISVDTVKVQLFRARNRLRREMTSGFDDLGI